MFLNINLSKKLHPFNYSFSLGYFTFCIRKFCTFQTKSKNQKKMKRTALLILVRHRQETAKKVQKILTGWGCYIKTRLGIHDGVLENCSDSGLIFLELTGEKEKHEEISRKLNLVKGVDAKLVSLEV